MILTGPEILRRRARGDIVIEPFAEEQVNPNSYDVRLGGRLVVYERGGAPLDVRSENPTEDIEIPTDGLVLRPGVIYLGSTVERVGSDRLVGSVEGKSSLGRLGLTIHITAGFLDTGFVGHLTLEIMVVEPLRIYPGIRIAQVCFSSVEGEVVRYSGKYQDQGPDPQPSRSWLDS